MRTTDFDFELPEQLIAQVPAAQRELSRLLVLERDTGEIRHEEFRNLINYLVPGDLLLLNDSRVIPAQLHGSKGSTGGQIEILLLEENDVNVWWAMLRPGKRLRVGAQVYLRDLAGQATQILATVIEKNEEGHGRLQFSGVANIFDELNRLGSVPLPPYIGRGAETNDLERYQTVYATKPGSVAAPTAGLHFSDTLLADFRARGVAVDFVTLHVGLGTFAPVKSELVEEHRIHEERFELSNHTADLINKTKQNGHRIVAVGTTTVRVLETAAAAHPGSLVGMRGRTRIFIYPPYQFRVTDALVTNFHLPRSTLLMLVSAFAAPGETRGRELILSAYEQAIRERYRFFSYGDAMLMV